MKKKFSLKKYLRYRLGVGLLFLSGVSFLHSQDKLDLASAIRTCNRDSNEYLKAEAWKIEAARANVLISKASGNIKYNNQAIHLGRPNLFAPETNFYNKINMQTLHQVTKTVPYPGQRAARISFAKEHLNLASLEYEQFEFSFKKQLTDLWLDAWMESRKAALYARHYGELDSITKLVKQKVSAGDMKHLQILQEEYLLKMNKTKVIFNNESRRIKLWLGTSKELDFSTLNWVEKYKTPSLSYDSIAKLVSGNRPEFSVLQEKEVVAKKELRVARNSVWEEPEVGVLINPQNTIPYFGTYFTFTLPSFDLKRGDIRKAKITQEETKHRNSIIEKELNVEAQNIVDLYTINFVDLQLAYNYKLIGETEVKNAREGFVDAKVEILDYLQAERDYFQAQMSYFEALYDFFKSKSDFLFATGLVKTVW